MTDNKVSSCCGDTNWLMRYDKDGYSLEERYVPYCLNCNSGCQLVDKPEPQMMVCPLNGVPRKMPEIEVNIEILCGRCGAGLCNQTTASKTFNRREPVFIVEPCEKCLNAAEDKGYEKGCDSRCLE